MIFEDFWDLSHLDSGPTDICDLASHLSAFSLASVGSQHHCGEETGGRGERSEKFEEV